MSTRCISWGKGGRCVRLTTLPPSCAVVMKSGNLNFLEPSGPLQACNGTALPYIEKNCASSWSFTMNHLSPRLKLHNPFDVYNYSVCSFKLFLSNDMKWGRSQWPRGLRRSSAAASFLELRFRIPPGSCMFFTCKCRQVEVSATGWSFVHRSRTKGMCVLSMIMCNSYPLHLQWMGRKMSD